MNNSRIFLRLISSVSLLHFQTIDTFDSVNLSLSGGWIPNSSLIFHIKNSQKIEDKYEDEK